MLAHGTRVFQWQAVIGFFLLGSLMVNSLATFRDEQSLGMDVAGFPKSRIKSNFWGSAFKASNNAPFCLEGVPYVYTAKDDQIGMLCAMGDCTDANVDPFDLFDQVPYDDLFGLVIWVPLGHWEQRHENHKRLPPPLDPLMALFCFACNIFYAKWKKANALRLVTRSSNWVALGSSSRTGYSHCPFAGFFFWCILLGFFSPALGVTCRSCLDGIEGCAGGPACLFATQTAANLAALAVAGGAAINVVSLLPASYIRHLPTQVLRTLAAIARVPAADGPPDLGAMTLTELQECLASGRCDVSSYKAELSSRLADPATAAAQVARISAMLLGVQNNSVSVNTRTIDGINSYGVLGYLVAVASLIVNSGKRTYSSGATSTTGASSGGGGSSLSIRAPTSGSQFAELLMVWQTLAHAVGAANILATGPFIQQVVWDGISTLGLLWEQAYCLFIIYLEAIEDSLGVLHLANVFAAGAQDTRLRAANKRYSETFCPLCDDQDDKDKDRDQGSKKWNKKDSPNANGVCKTYNFRDAEHPKQHLHKDGTCKFRHVCNQWVTGKGPSGMCEGDHPKWGCTNPNKTNTKPTQ